MTSVARAPVRTVTFTLKEITAVITCGQCAKGLPYQGSDDAPACAECGWQSPATWSKVLLEGFEFPGRLKRKDGHALVMFAVKAELNTKTVSELRCTHCDGLTKVSGEWFVDGAKCQGCSRSFFSREINKIDNEAFAIVTVPQKGPKQISHALSITCASCGAPLTTDGTQRTVDCQFCHAANVVPALARVRIVLDTMYAALISDVTEVPRAWIFEDSAVDAALALTLHKHRLRDEEYAHLLVKHRNSLEVYRAVTDVHHYFPSAEVAEKLTGSDVPEISTWAFERMKTHNESLERYAAQEKAKMDKQRRALIIPIVLGVLFMIGLFALVWFSPSSD